MSVLDKSSTPFSCIAPFYMRLALPVFGHFPFCATLVIRSQSVPLLFCEGRAVVRFHR